MKSNMTIKINSTELHAALLYLKMNQLKLVCERFALDSSGNKIALIERITTFINTGKKIISPVMPEKSKAKRRDHYPLAPQTVMLYGAYKNDLATRVFFKNLIGNHFHFTAYGIDWLNERWMAGNPPTYAEFAQFWKEEHLRRKTSKPQPKEEWKYINFTQEYISANPHASKDEIMAAWKDEQEKMVQKIMHMLDIELSELS